MCRKQLALQAGWLGSICKYAMRETLSVIQAHGKRTDALRGDRHHGLAGVAQAQRHGHDGHETSRTMRA